MNIITGFAGLNTTVDPSELPHDPSKVYLSSCSNVDITDANKLSRRVGNNKITSTTLGNAGSGYPNGNYIVYVEGDALSVRDNHGTIIRIRNVTAGAVMRYTTDVEGRVFYTNGYEHGYILGVNGSTWVAPNDFTGPTTVTTTKSVSPAPVGHLLTIMGGYMMIAVDRNVIISQPFNPFEYILNEGNLVLDSRLRMMRAVTGGLWLSTDRGIFFYRGREPHEFDPIRVTESPVVEGTDVEVDADKMRIDFSSALSGIGILVTTEESILYLTEDGQKVDLSEGRITFPKGSTGTAVYKDGRYTTIINTNE